MEKVIKIDNRDIKLVANGGLLLRYRMAFNKDPLRDILKMQNIENDLSTLDTEVLYNLFYVMAKGGDNSIGDMLTFFDSFEALPLEDILPPVVELLSHSLGSIKKK